MASQQLTSYQGRRCTKVRRAVTAVANNSTAKVTDIATTPAPAEKSTSKKSVYAPTTNTPASAVAIPLPSSHAPAAPSPEPVAPTPVVAPPASPQVEIPASRAPNPPASPQSSVVPVPIPAPPGTTAPPLQNTHVAIPASAIPPPSHATLVSGGSGGGSGSDSGGSSGNEGSSNGNGGGSGESNGGSGGSSGGSGNSGSSGSSGGSGGSSGSGGSGGNGGGSGQNGNGGHSGGSGNQQARPLSVSSVVISVGHTGRVSAIPMSLGGTPIVVSGKGASPTDSVIPVPIVFSTEGSLLTSTVMAPTGVPLSLGGKGSLVPVKTTDLSVPTSNSKTGSTGAASINATNQLNGSPSKGVIAGVVTGVFIMAIVGALIFVCVRRSLRRRDNRNSVVDAGLATQKSPLTSHIREFFGKRRSKESSDDSMRSSTPALERGLRNSMQRRDSFNRQRASSEPASRALNGGQRTQDDIPRIPSVAEHRRSVSSVSGLAYPVLSESNNPFLDPDPNATLRIVNPDASRLNTPATTPRAQKSNSFTPQTPGYPFPSPFLNNSKLSPISPALAARHRSPPPPPSAFARTSRTSNPFADPPVPPVSAADQYTAAMEDPFADPRPASSEYYSPASSYNSPPRANHSRTRTLAAIAGMPKIVRTAPSIASTSTLHGRHGGSQDSGFVSINSTNTSPHMASLSRFPSANQPQMQQGLGIGGMGIERSLSTGSTYHHRHLPSTSSAPRSSTVVGRLSNLAPLNTYNANAVDSRLLTIPSPTGLTPSDEHPKRLSTTSEASSSLSLAFPSSWGEPGPTRPASVAARSSHSGRSGSSGEKVPPSASSVAGSRVSDPFDLDVPELLTYAGSEVGSSGSVRRGSGSDAGVGSQDGTGSIASVRNLKP